MCKDCNDWKLSGIQKRDFQHSHDGPEEIKGRPKRKSKWCKGKEGREHEYEQYIWHTYKYIDSYGKERTRDTYRWRCKGCGKIEWSLPRPKVPKHKHCFCKTEIIERRWRNYQEIMESCCICNGKGRSYKFYN